MHVLVTGSTGTIGSRVVRDLAAQGVTVRGLTRSPGSASAPSGDVSFVEGDLERPDSVREALRDVDRMFLLTPLHPEEGRLGQEAIAAARDADLSRLVFLSVHHADDAPDVPHFASKMLMRKAAAESGLAYVEVAPNSFYQNDLWLRDALMDGGVYPTPVGQKGLNRVDADDIATVVVQALTGDVEVDGPVPVVGPDALTGDSIAETWSRHLGRDVHAVEDLDAWAAHAGRMMPEWLVEDLVAMVRHFLARGLRATDEDFATQARFLGRPPRSYDAFVRDTVAAWTAGG